MSKRDAPATARNREPILEGLARWLVEPARVLEIASGTGQHAVYFAERMPHLEWQPSDRAADLLESIEAWVADAGLPNVRRPIVLDAAASTWPVAPGDFDAIFNANMIHIAPWPVALGLFAGAGRTLEAGGLLFLYGPFRVDGQHTAPSNAAFDENLRARDPDWGVRDLTEVRALAETHGLSLVEESDLPANNKLIVFRKEPPR